MGHKKVCLNCRKAFNQNSDFEIQSGLSCPECGQKMTEVNHKFQPPKKADLKSWKVVKFLIENGFLFQHVYKNFEEKNELVSNEKYVNYPTNISDAKLFVREFKNQAIKE
jgi:predicted  nucleic acid-binding Zn-ribbon protein